MYNNLTKWRISSVKVKVVKGREQPIMKTMTLNAFQLGAMPFCLRKYNTPCRFQYFCLRFEG